MRQLIACLILCTACVPMAGTQIVAGPYGWHRDGANFTLDGAVAGDPSAQAEARLAHRLRRHAWYWLAGGLALEAAAITTSLVLFDRKDDIAAGSVVLGGGLGGIGIGLWCQHLLDDASDHEYRAVELYNADVARMPH